MAKEIAPAKEFTAAPVEAATEPSWVNDQTEAPAPVSENWADDVVQAPVAAAPVVAVAGAPAPQAFASSGDWASQVKNKLVFETCIYTAESGVIETIYLVLGSR